MNKYIKKSLMLSIGALLSTAAFADTTYTYSVDANNLLTTTVDGVDYTYQLADDYTVLDSSTSQDVTNGTANNTIFYDADSSAAVDAVARVTASSASISSVFIGNDSTYSADTANGAGAIYLNANGKLATISGLFVDNTSYGYGGAITLYANTSSASSISGTFVNNYAAVRGGAISNAGTISDLSGTFINNSAANNGGAIFNASTGTINITATTADTVFTGNTTGSVSNAIYNAGTITFNSSDGYSIIVNDGISSGNNLGDMTIQTGTTVFNNTVAQKTLTVNSGATLALGSYGDASADLSAVTTFTVNGTLSLSLSDAGTIKLCDVLFNEGSALVLDMSDIFGDFSLDITLVDGSSLDSFTVYLDDGSSESISLADGDYDLSSDYYSDLSVSLTGTTYTISGTAVPEPSTYAMIFGVVALGFAAYRRRK